MIRLAEIELQDVVRRLRSQVVLLGLEDVAQMTALVVVDMASIGIAGRNGDSTQSQSTPSWFLTPTDARPKTVSSADTVRNEELPPDHALLAGGISFVVAHRLSTIRHADLALVLNHAHSSNAACTMNWSSHRRPAPASPNASPAGVSSAGARREHEVGLTLRNSCILSHRADVFFPQS